MYQQIGSAIGDEITIGRTVPEQRLPAQRKLAEVLGIDYGGGAERYTDYPALDQAPA